MSSATRPAHTETLPAKRISATAPNTSRHFTAAHETARVAEIEKAERDLEALCDRLDLNLTLSHSDERRAAAEWRVFDERAGEYIAEGSSAEDVVYQATKEPS